MYVKCWFELFWGFTSLRLYRDLENNPNGESWIQRKELILLRKQKA